MSKKHIGFMYLLSFIVMFVTMYAMVYVFDHVYININKVYMATLMVGSMGVVNVAVMYKMYDGSLFKYSVFGVSVLAMALSLVAIRNQTFVNDEQFLKSMIPHHSSAILMCEKTTFDDPEIAELCDEIVDTQRREIELMENKLQKLND